MCQAGPVQHADDTEKNGYRCANNSLKADAVMVSRAMVLWAWGYLLEVPKALRPLSSLTAGDRKAGEREEVLSGAHGASGSPLTPAYRDMAAHVTTSTATTLVATDTKKKSCLGVERNQFMRRESWETRGWEKIFSSESADSHFSESVPHDKAEY